MKTPTQIIEEAIRTYKPIKFALLFSGGHDSHVSSHVSAQILKSMGLEFVVYHGDTTIGIPETQQYVKDICKLHGWKLEIRKPPDKKDYYDNIVRRWGFPGPNKQSHQMCYFRLKERALRAFVTHELKSSPNARENVLLISGVRTQESRIRMGYRHETRKEDSRVWTCPIFWWSEEDCNKYMKEHNLPRNPVKDKLCISGECLCGAFAGDEELAEINEAYPHVGKVIADLGEMAKKNGFPWPWSQGPTEWFKNHPPGMIDMFTDEVNQMPMCVNCNNNKKFKQ